MERRQTEWNIRPLITKRSLKYVSERYAGVFWNTTPRKVAQFFANTTKVSEASEA